MSDVKQFDWDAFNEVLQGSAYICSGARKDIERAIAVGKDKPKREVKAGQIYDAGPSVQRKINLRLIVLDVNRTLASVDLHDGRTVSGVNPVSYVADNSYSLVADSLAEYVAQGGKL